MRKWSDLTKLLNLIEEDVEINFMDSFNTAYLLLGEYLKNIDDTEEESQSDADMLLQKKIF